MGVVVVAVAISGVVGGVSRFWSLLCKRTAGIAIERKDEDTP